MPDNENAPDDPREESVDEDRIEGQGQEELQPESDSEVESEQEPTEEDEEKPAPDPDKRNPEKIIQSLSQKTANQQRAIESMSEKLDRIIASMDQKNDPEKQVEKAEPIQSELDSILKASDDYEIDPYKAARMVARELYEIKKSMGPSRDVAELKEQISRLQMDSHRAAFTATNPEIADRYDAIYERVRERVKNVKSPEARRELADEKWNDYVEEEKAKAAGKERSSGKEKPKGVQSVSGSRTGVAKPPTARGNRSELDPSILNNLIFE